jgi:hypothetical protein
MRKKFLLLVAAFGVAIGAASFNFGGERANALTNAQISGISLAQFAISTSFDGNKIAFLSPSTSLVSGDTNNYVDAFLRDISAATTTRINVSSGGAEANAPTTKVLLSGNGRYALITSQADNLASGGDLYASNVYLRDLSLGQTYLIAAGDYGSFNQLGAALSEDGRFVYYQTQGGPNTGGLFVYDRLLTTNTRVDTDAGGTVGNNGTNNSLVSTTCDGRFVVFASASTNLVSGDTNGKQDIFLTDTMNGRAVTNITITANDKSVQPTITCDGNYVFFYSSANNLVSGDTNSAQDLFKYSVEDNTIQRVNIDPSGNEYGATNSASGGVPGSNSTRISSMDGRYVAFGIDKISPSTGVQLSGQIFLRDTVANTTTALSPISSNTFAELPIVTYEGRTTYYLYSASATGVLSKNVYSATNYL